MKIPTNSILAGSGGKKKRRIKESPISKWKSDRPRPCRGEKENEKGLSNFSRDEGKKKEKGEKSVNIIYLAKN